MTSPEGARATASDAERVASPLSAGYGPGVAAADISEAPRGSHGASEIAALIPMVRRVVRSRVSDHPSADDLVQETLVRVLGAAQRVEPGMLEPYAIVTARHLVASMWKEQDRHRRNLHRVVDVRLPALTDAELLRSEERAAVAHALERLSERDRRTLLAHEIDGRATQHIAEEIGSTAGAVAAQLNRTRARLRVEYLFALEKAEPCSDRCRPVLLAVSGGDRRRQREVGAGGHLLECELCARLSQSLLGRARKRDDEMNIAIARDADVVSARQGARALAARVGFTGTDLTVIATAVSEVSRNIVRFAGEGQVLIEIVEDPRPGIRVIARDRGPGIEDVEQALGDGYSTYHGLGLGLPGARRLMDEFAIVSARNVGTTVTMTKWLKEG